MSESEFKFKPPTPDGIEGLPAQLDDVKEQLRIPSKLYEEALTDRVVQKVSQHFLTLGKALVAIVFAIFAYFGFPSVFGAAELYFA